MMFRRLPWYKRLRCLRIWQPIDAIDATDAGIRLSVGGAWTTYAWSDIRDAVIDRREYFPSRKFGSAVRTFTPEEAERLADERRARPHGFAGKHGSVIESDMLSFEAGSRTFRIDISLLTPHFDHDMELRAIVMNRLRPRIEKQTWMQRMAFWSMVIVITAVIVAFIGAYVFL